MSIKNLAAELQARGVGVEVKEFGTTVNTALWRRKKDLFDKKGGLVHLRTKDIEFEDQLNGDVAPATKTTAP